MFRRRLLAVAAVCGMIVAGLARPAVAANRTIVVPGRAGVTNNLVVFVNRLHGPPTKIEFYYPLDGYVHVDILQARDNVSDINLVTCANPESALPNAGHCGDRVDTDQGTRGLYRGDGSGIVPGSQPHTAVNHHRTVTESPSGPGRTLYEEHFEHGVFSHIDFTWADHQTLDLFVDGPNTGCDPCRGTYVQDVNIVSHAGDTTAAWTSVDGGAGGV